MNNIINLTTARRERLHERAKGVTLCRSGFHKWETLTDQRFDVRQGKLITVQRCIRCEQARVKLT